MLYYVSAPIHFLSDIEVQPVGARSSTISETDNLCALNVRLQYKDVCVGGLISLQAEKSK